MPAQKEREQNALLERLEHHAEMVTPDKKQIARGFMDRGVQDDVIFAVADELYAAEGLRPTDRPAIIGDAITAARYQEELQRYINNTRPDRYEKFGNALVNILSKFATNDDGQGLFRSRRPRTRKEIEDLILSFINEDGLFKKLIDQLNQNYREEKEVMPSKSKVDNYAWAYLKDTPLLALEYV